MAKYKVGQKYGRITILEIFPYHKSMGSQRNGSVVCDCSPDKPYIMNIYNLGTGHTQSCGCYAQEKAVKTNTLHGLSKTPEYNIYRGMLARCTRKTVPNYKNYGGRGITVCDRWLEGKGQGFLNFMEDMGTRPSSEHSIDRIDVNGNYSPDNCRWATTKEQGNNRQHHRIITIDGVSKNLAQWSEEAGIDCSVIFTRLKRGWTEKEAVTTPILDENKYYKFRGEVISHQNLAKKYDIHEATLRDRLKKGMSLEEAVTKSTDTSKYLTFRGETKTVKDWSDVTGIPTKLIHGRLEEGWNVEDTLTKPKFTPKTYTFQGKTQGLTAWAKELKVSYKYLHKRLQKESFETIVEELLSRE